MSDSCAKGFREVRGKQDILKADWHNEFDLSNFTRQPQRLLGGSIGIRTSVVTLEFVF